MRLVKIVGPPRTQLIQAPKNMCARRVARINASMFVAELATGLIAHSVGLIAD
jgi:Co/Zn/Cd efflux system component